MRCAIEPGLAARPDAAALLAPASEDLFASRLWFDTLSRHAAPAGLSPAYVLADAPAPAMLLPVWRDARGIVSGLTSPYTLGFRPLLRAASDARATGAAFARSCRLRPPVRLDALDPDLPWLPEFTAGLREGGLLAQRYDHFGNWYEPVAGFAFADYLASRPGALRSTIRRKLKLAEKSTRFALIRDGAGLEQGIAAFEAVYAKSWKEAEPFPSFNAGFMRALAGAGLLRLGLLYADELPVAGQYWTVSGEAAVLHKLAHDETALALSPGTVLTALMIRSVLEEDKVLELDFGRGDDPYKQNWVSRRRQRIGLSLIDPRHPRGLAELAITRLGAARRRLRPLLNKRTEPA
jgi:hypothetical protein